MIRNRRVNLIHKDLLSLSAGETGRASKWTQWIARAKRVVQSKRMSEWTSEWPSALRVDFIVILPIVQPFDQLSYLDAGIFVHAACWITCAFLNSKSLAFDRPLMVAWSKVAWLLVSNHTDDPQNSKDLEIFRFFSTYDCWLARSFLIACSLARQLKSYSLFSLATKRRIGSCKKDEHWWRSAGHSSPARERNFLKKN